MREVVFSGIFMKVLLSERSFKGHRRTYMEWLIKIKGIDIYCLAPENPGVSDSHFIKCESLGDLKSVRDYLKWILQMRVCVKAYAIDVVHILDGDTIMRYFGCGFDFIGAKKLIITYHHFFEGSIRRMSYRCMCNKKSHACVVHTKTLKNSLCEIGIKNVFQCEYPSFTFNSIAQKDKIQSKNKFGVPLDVPTIGIIGGMNKYKNIIGFLDSIQTCKEDFHLLICGKANDITADEIFNLVKSYREKVTVNIRTLSQEEYEDAIVASDIIFAIYGYEFDGASGPLTDAVCAKKMILSCAHGSLGDIVSQNCLGLIVSCDSKIDILRQTEVALRTVDNFQYGEAANKYRELLNPEHFLLTYKKIYINAKL